MASTHRHRPLRIGLFILTNVIFLVLTGISFGGEEHSLSEVPSNLLLMQRLGAKIAKQVIEGARIAKGDTVSVRVATADDGWIVQEAFLSALSSVGCRLYLANSPDQRVNLTVDLSGVNLNVRYDDMFRDGLMGSKKVRRSVHAILSCRVTSLQSAEVLFSHIFSESHADTVLLDDINTLELSSVKSTHAELPSEMFLDRVLEPFVIIGATGVAVYLFFHIRS